MLYVLHNNVCGNPLLYSVGKKLLKLVYTPLNVGLQKIDVSSALLFLLMQMSNNDILLPFLFFVGEFDMTMAIINVSKRT